MCTHQKQSNPVPNSHAIELFCPICNIRSFIYTSSPQSPSLSPRLIQSSINRQLPSLSPIYFQNPEVFLNLFASFISDLYSRGFTSSQINHQINILLSSLSQILSNLCPVED